MHPFGGYALEDGLERGALNENSGAQEAQKSPGEPRRTQESPGETQRRQERPRGARRTQENQG